MNYVVELVVTVVDQTPLKRSRQRHKTNLLLLYPSVSMSNQIQVSGNSVLRVGCVGELLAAELLSSMLPGVVLLLLEVAWVAGLEAVGSIGTMVALAGIVVTLLTVTQHNITKLQEKLFYCFIGSGKYFRLIILLNKLCTLSKEKN